MRCPRGPERKCGSVHRCFWTGIDHRGIIDPSSALALWHKWDSLGADPVLPLSREADLEKCLIVLAHERQTTVLQKHAESDHSILKYVQKTTIFTATVKTGTIQRISNIDRIS